MQRSHPTMTKEELNSDKVNYLIWRYLQESNYQGTAVKLQAEWDVVDPQSLDFAPHVQSHALVHILQRGLLFHEAERRAAQARRHPGAAAPAVGFFGPVPPLSPPLAPEDDPINGRKRSSEERPQHSRPSTPAKRTKLSNGYENGIEPTPMDVDEQDSTDANSNNGHVYPSPEEDNDHSQLSMPATNGPERATQAEKSYNLSKEAHCLDLSSDATKAMPILTQCEWNPKDASPLVTIGMDVEPRSWKFSTSNGAVKPRDRFQAEHEDLLVAKAAITGSVDYVSWSPNGALLAIASTSDNNGIITIMGKDKEVHDRFVSAGSPPITCLRWNLTNDYLLALTAPDGKGGSSWVTVYGPSNQTGAPYQLAPGSQPEDAQWTKDGNFVVCDAETLIAFEYSQGRIIRAGAYHENGGPSLLAYDIASGLLATATEGGKIIVWDGSEKHMEIVHAHEGPVTALKWQPNGRDGEILLASSGEDKTVKLWRLGANKSYKPIRTLDLDSGVLALAFTPRGDFLAAATNGHVGIWDMNGASIATAPVAYWSRGKEPGWQSPKQTNGHVPEEDHHVLCWDAEGSKLVYGVNSMLVVIEFDPAQLGLTGTRSP